MKLFDIDWADFIERLTEWERLSLTARKAFAEMKSNQGKEVTDFDGHAPDLAAAGFLAYYADGRRVKLCKECYRWNYNDGFEESLLDQPGVLKAVQKVVGEFKTFTEPITFRDLPRRFATLPAGLLGTAILASIRCLFLFPAMRPDDMAPILGLWPTITERLHRLKAQRAQSRQAGPDLS